MADEPVVTDNSTVTVSTSTSTVTSVGEESWMKTYWRPSMAWLYMLICFMDFVGFPLATMILPGFSVIQYTAWKPITLDNGGMIHMSFGAILGIAAWTRGAYEKKS